MSEANSPRLSVHRGFDARMGAPWCPPVGASSPDAADYTPTLRLRAVSEKKDFVLPDGNAEYSNDVGGFVYKFPASFTQTIPPGAHPFVAGATRTVNGDTENYEIGRGVLCVEEIGSMSVNARILRDLKLIIAKKMENEDVEVTQLSMPGSAAYTKLSVVELSKLADMYGNKVSFERSGVGVAIMP